MDAHDALSDSAIMRILNDDQPLARISPQRFETHVGTGRNCPRCEQSIEVETLRCPHCQRYVGPGHAF